MEDDVVNMSGNFTVGYKWEIEPTDRIETKYYFEPYDVRFNISSTGLAFNGRYKVEFKLQAYDQTNKLRPQSICFICTVFSGINPGI
ncbi:uncharacterized protein Dwil_GK24357 [Drosophila willistoni]|uniref:Uncharacterized protein n=1 Tax=Drosophila willistoni TaxID=7260 RepID=A0A0Q9X1W7_DROWI|nr:uncharacterized protein Dwil_GK24357 [Drosophila willistoni]